MKLLIFLLLSCLPFLGYSQQGDNSTSIFQINKRDSVALIGVTFIPAQVFESTELKYLSVWGQDCCLPSLPSLAIIPIIY